MFKPGRRGQRATRLKYLTKTGKCSERRACVVVGLSRPLVRYIARRSKDEAMLIKEIHKLAIRHTADMGTVGLSCY